jgi:hypothetical protein
MKALFVISIMLYLTGMVIITAMFIIKQQAKYPRILPVTR